MVLGRRTFMKLGAAGAAAASLPRRRVALGSDYPMRPVQVVVGFPPGGATDIIARLIAQRLAERLGQHFVVLNRPGAGGNIATAAVARAYPDGYTLLLISGSNIYNMTLYEHLDFDFIHDITPIA